MRYELVVELSPVVRLTLRDGESNEIQRRWSGPVADHLVSSGILPVQYLRGGRHRCDKTLVWHLILAATAASLAVEQLKLTLQPWQVFTNNPIEAEAIPDKLGRHGIYPTAQRIRVARVLFDRPGRHYTAAQVFDKVKTNGGGCSLATVYNCLELFTERKLLQEIVVQHGLVFYDTVTTPHPHLYNIDTGELRDIDTNQPLRQWLPALPADTKLESACLVVQVRNKRSSLGQSAL